MQFQGSVLRNKTGAELCTAWQVGHPTSLVQRIVAGQGMGRIHESREDVGELVGMKDDKGVRLRMRRAHPIMTWQAYRVLIVDHGDRTYRPALGVGHVAGSAAKMLVRPHLDFRLGHGSRGQQDQ
jgi:hypothetical protein